MKRFLGFIFAVAAFSILIGTSAAAGIGISSIIVNSSSASVAAGNSASIAYIVNLTSGSPWGTTIAASNAGALSSDGITLSFSDSYGDPTYSGTLSIATSPSTPSGVYNISLSATGDDPSSAPAMIALTVSGKPSTNVSNVTTTVKPVTPDYFSVISKATFAVNGSTGGTFTLNHVITAVIPANTFVSENGNVIRNYNFSIVDFSVPSSLSGPNSSLVPYGAYAFAVNGQVNSSISFINSIGKFQAIKSLVVGGPNDTSWTYLGGAYNGSTYKGGTYTAADVWTHPNNSVMVNDVFFKPVMWVFEEPAPKVTTTVPTTTAPVTVSKATTVPTTVSATPYPGSNEGVIAAIVVIIVVVAAVAIFALRKKK